MLSILVAFRILLVAFAVLAVALHTMSTHYNDKSYKVASYFLSASLLVMLGTFLVLNFLTSFMTFLLVVSLGLFAGVFHTKEFQPYNVRGV